ncbi:MAG: hypothetical protein AAF202_07075 [Pseudomonadota bacterium]
MIRYWNYQRFLPCVVLFVIAMGLFTGCQGATKRLKESPPPEPIRLEFKGSDGLVRETLYHSHSYIREYEFEQLVKEKDEIVDFTIQESFKKPKKPNTLAVEVTSKDKDGIVDLHDLAFPEVDEVIMYVYDKMGNVLLAGGYPEQSIFYVPPMPLPEKKVEVGDTWESESEWISLKNGIPLKVGIVGILKNFYACGAEKCADIEVSGAVEVLGMKKTDVSFLSEISGRVLYNVDKGMPVWSLIKSTEDLRMKDSRTAVQSCVTSKMKMPADAVAFLKLPSKLRCRPKSEDLPVPF